MSYKIDPNKVRQGDVYVNRKDAVPKGAKKRRDRKVALGEATGHSHDFNTGVVYGEMENEYQWVVLQDEAELEHLPSPGVEHDTIVIPWEVNRVHIQRVYTPEGIQRARD